MARAAFFFLLTVLPASALATCGATENEISALGTLVQSDPTVSANTALAQGNTNFLGVAGYTITVPGAETPNCTIDPTAVHVLPGTTDVICSAKHAQLIKRASEFAST